VASPVFKSGTRVSGTSRARRLRAFQVALRRLKGQKMVVGDVQLLARIHLVVDIPIGDRLDLHDAGASDLQHGAYSMPVCAQ
jgi:hypothetical protein